MPVVPLTARAIWCHDGLMQERFDARPGLTRAAFLVARIAEDTLWSGDFVLKNLRRNERPLRYGICIYNLVMTRRILCAAVILEMPHLS